jgi:PAS domain-containing protein
MPVYNTEVQPTLLVGGHEEHPFLKVSAVPVFLDGRNHVIVALSDITGRKLAEEALTQSEKRYRLLFERNLAGVFRATLDGRLLECNQATARMFGYENPQDAWPARLQVSFPPLLNGRRSSKSSGPKRPSPTTRLDFDARMVDSSGRLET